MVAKTDASLQYLLVGALAPSGMQRLLSPSRRKLPAWLTGIHNTPKSLRSGELPFIYKNSHRKKKICEYLSKQIFASDMLLCLSDMLIFLFIRHVSPTVSECTVKCSHLKIMNQELLPE